MSRDPIERSLEIEQAQLRGFARSIADVEWLLLILVVLYLFIGNPGLARSPAVLGVLLGFAAFVLVFRYARPFAGSVHVKLAIEILAMLAFQTAVLVFAGGRSSPLVNLYLLPIVTAALALGKRATALVMILVCGCYALVEGLTVGTAGLNVEFALAVVGVLAPFALVAFCTTLLVDNINTAKRRIRALSDRDELTGLYNLRAFTRLAEQEHDVASRAGRRYSVLMVDIDHLKELNDTYGHDAGNRAVKLVAEALTRLTRSTDLVARYGDDEFVVLLGNADKDVADEVAQRIRNVVFSTTLEVDVKMVRIKAHVGAATFPDHGNALPVVVAAADRLMYKDKELREPPKGKLIVTKL
ncbi:MAG TPA: GGDEF domain-containing protein [Gammaproteobacteria bacterium]|jgi:diguanylate cyclase (GGDEF)-like protein|nr:GGDEF domain-containing protein [Gammaproteobacteria bacterium]